jgi:hypothetical protein
MIPHFALPFRIRGARGAVVNEQDSEAEILACVEAIVRYQKGQRPEKPDFGIDDPTFSSPLVDSRAIEADINEFEPRTHVSVSDPVVQDLIQSITIGGDK